MRKRKKQSARERAETSFAKFNEAIALLYTTENQSSDLSLKILQSIEPETPLQQRWTDLWIAICSTHLTPNQGTAAEKLLKDILPESWMRVQPEDALFSMLAYRQLASKYMAGADFEKAIQTLSELLLLALVHKSPMADAAKRDLEFCVRESKGNQSSEDDQREGDAA